MTGVGRIRQVTENTHLNFYELEARKRDGGTFPYYMASRAVSKDHLFMNEPSKGPDGVAVFGVYGEKADKVVLIRQYRYPLGGYVYEFPAGLVEPGEDIHRSAVREMKEETGLDLELEEADPMFERPFFTTVGMTDENCSMVFGRCSGQVSSRFEESTEDIEVVLADRKEVLRILRQEQTTIICAYMLLQFLQHPGDPFAFLKLAAESGQK